MAVFDQCGERGSAPGSPGKGALARMVHVLGLWSPEPFPARVTQHLSTDLLLEVPGVGGQWDAVRGHVPAAARAIPCDLFDYPPQEWRLGALAAPAVGDVLRHSLVDHAQTGPGDGRAPRHACGHWHCADGRGTPRQNVVRSGDCRQQRRRSSHHHTHGHRAGHSQTGALGSTTLCAWHRHRSRQLGLLH